MINIPESSGISGNFVPEYPIEININVENLFWQSNTIKITCSLQTVTPPPFWRKPAIWISLVFLAALIFIGIIVMVTIILIKTKEWPGKPVRTWKISDTFMMF